MTAATACKVGSGVRHSVVGGFGRVGRWCMALNGLFQVFMNRRRCHLPSVDAAGASASLFSPFAAGVVLASSDAPSAGGAGTAVSASIAISSRAGAGLDAVSDICIA